MIAGYILLERANFFAKCLAITKKDIIDAHNLLVTFCKTYECLYGVENCTLNMHMACHSKECMLDYGAIAAFWCLSFERYNGIMEGMSLSWLGPEKQMFLKFNNLQCIFNMLEDSSRNSGNDFVAVAVASLQKFHVTSEHDSVEQTNSLVHRNSFALLFSLRD